MQVVSLRSLRSNGPQISKKSCGYKDLTQINKLTLKPVINEQLKLKNKEQTQQKYKNAVIMPNHIP